MAFTTARSGLLARGTTEHPNLSCISRASSGRKSAPDMFKRLPQAVRSFFSFTAFFKHNQWSIHLQKLDVFKVKIH